MKVALFGATGFVGSYIVDELLNQGHKPIVLVRKDSEKKLPQSSKCKIVVGDINDLRQLIKLSKVRMQLSIVLE